MSQRHYLLNTSVLSSDSAELASGTVVEVAEANYVIPLPWILMFQRSDLRPSRIMSYDEPIDTMIPCITLLMAINCLRESFPLFEDLTGERHYAHHYWKHALNDLGRLKLPYLTLNVDEIFLNMETDEFTTTFKAALGRDASALATMKKYFFNYHDGVLPYDRQEFHNGVGIDDDARRENTIILDAGIWTGMD
jgi:hypothetical protein